ncbi:MAG: SRPBCC family protein [Thermoleophilaceae bacterium]
MAERSAVVSVTVAAPQEHVWDLICDTARYAEWVDATDEVVRTDGPAALGSTYEERNTVLGPIKSGSRWTVAEHDPPRRSVHRGEGIAIAKDVSLEMTLQSLGGESTEVTFTFRYEPAFGPFGRLLSAAVLHRQVEAGFRRSAGALAEIATREHGAAART